MKKSFEKLAAAIIYADGDVAESELSHLQKLATQNGIDTAGISTAIEAGIETLKPLDEDHMKYYD